MQTQTQTQQKSQPKNAGARPATAPAQNTPSHKLFHVRDRGSEKKAFWQEVGVAFTNRDGSLTVKLNYVPTAQGDGLTLQLRVNEPRQAGDGANDDDNRDGG